MGTVRTGSPSYSRVSNFVGLFTEEEMAEWEAFGAPPDWVREAMSFFIDKARLEVQ